jgi:VWFA-related protein
MNHGPRNFALVAATLVLGIVPSPAQEEPATPLLHSHSRLVLIDAVVTDKKGNLVPGLATADFHLKVDGREQPIASLSTVAEAPPETRGLEYVMLLFDQLPDSAQQRARDATIRFLEDNADPRRVYAILRRDDGGELQILQNFTSDTAALLRVLRLPMFTRNGAPRMIATTADEYMGQRRHPGAMGTQATPWSRPEDYLLNLEKLANDLANIDGRKTIVLFTRGLRLRTADQNDLLAHTADAFSRANVVVHTVRALENSETDTSAFVTLSPLATRTGGSVYANETDVLDGLRKIDIAQRQHYLLAFVPATAADGSCHKLALATERKDLLLRARNQYCTSRAADPLAGGNSESKLEKAAAALPAAAAPQVASFYGSDGNARLSLAAEVPTAHALFDKQEGNFHLAMHVLGIAYKKDGSIGGRFTDDRTVDLTSKNEVEKFKSVPLRYRTQWALLPGDYNLVLLFDLGGTPIKLAEPFTVAPRNGRQLALSTPLLSNGFRDASSAATDISATLMAGRIPLVSRGIEFTQAASNRFGRGDPLAIYFEIYGDGAASAHFHLKVVEKSSGRGVLDTGPQESAPYARAGQEAIPVALRLDLHKLQAGTYSIEVQASSANGAETPVSTAELILQ